MSLSVPSFVVGSEDGHSRRLQLRWWHGWGPLLVLPSAVLVFAPTSWPRWAVMWSLALAIFSGCKWLTWRRTPMMGVTVSRHLGYLLAWPGMDSAAFLSSAGAATFRRPSASEWMFAFAKTNVGACLAFFVARNVPADWPYLAGWTGMVGIILLLHFGSFQLLSCAWRAVGVEARPLMNWPVVSVSLSEFWGRRWNTAFRDLTHRFLFRPLTAQVGPRAATLVGFVVSGLVHELVISVPAGGGFGGPTLFFLLQGVGLLVERTRFAKRIGLGHGWRGWLFTSSVLLLPVYSLFHAPFVLNVIVPFLRALGAL